MSDLTAVSQKQFPAAAKCGECHVEIYREWAASPHADAYVNPRYRDATDDYDFDGCLGCHAPQPQYSDKTPQVRMTSRQTGVTCVSCHLAEGKLGGPLTPRGLASPHPVEVNPGRYRRAAFCGRCHEGTFSQWKAAPMQTKPTCQHCHMPAVHRKMTQATDIFSTLLVAFEKAEAEKRHTFNMVGRGRPAVIGVTRRDGLVVLTVSNPLPHNLPTGDYGVRVVAVKAEALDAERKATVVGQWELTRSGDGAAIPAGGSRKWTFDVPAGARSIRVSLTRRGRGGARAATLLEKEIPLP